MQETYKRYRTHLSFVCRHCNTPFTRPPNYVTVAEPYCSKQCTSRARGKGFTKHCEVCGVEFGVAPSIAHRHRTCGSAACKKAMKSGAFNPNWKEGASADKRNTSTAEYRAWRSAVFERDDYTCQMCGQVGGDLNADHIKAWKLFPDLRFEISNGRTLCVCCHRSVMHEFYVQRNQMENSPLISL